MRKSVVGRIVMIALDIAKMPRSFRAVHDKCFIKPDGRSFEHPM